MIYKRRIKNTFYLYEVESVPNCISLSWLHSLPTPLRSYEYQELKGMDEYTKFQKLLVDDFFIYMIRCNSIELLPCRILDAIYSMYYDSVHAIYCVIFVNFQRNYFFQYKSL